MKNPPWSDAENQFLIQNYEKHGIQFCSSYLNRTTAAIKHQANKHLNLRINKKENFLTKPGDIICGSTVLNIRYEKYTSNKGNVYHRGYADCICHCGKNFTRDMANLSLGKKKGIMSCGCMRGKAKVVPKTVKKGKYFSQPYLTYLQKHSYRNGKQKVFELTIEILDELYEKQNGKCYWSGEKLTIPDVNKAFSPNRKEWNCSVDRINSKFGYTKDNVVLCTGKVNVCKMDLLPEDFIQMCNNVAKTHPR